MLKIAWIFFLLGEGISVVDPVEITWSVLKDVRFEDRYSDEVDAYYYYPFFGSSVKKLNGNLVYIKGYMLPLDPKNNIYILSRNSYASCFFCGAAGPDSIIELKLEPGHPKFKMDQVVTLKGRFRLNRDNVFECNYILEGAKIHRP